MKEEINCIQQKIFHIPEQYEQLKKLTSFAIKASSVIFSHSFKLFDRIKQLAACCCLKFFLLSLIDKTFVGTLLEALKKKPLHGIAVTPIYVHGNYNLMFHCKS